MQFKHLLFVFFTFLVITPYIHGQTDTTEVSESGSFEKDCRDSDESSGDSKDDSTSREDANSWESSFEKDEQICEELTDGAEENDGECDLIDGLEIIAENITIIEQKEIFLAFIAKLKAQLSIRVDITIIQTMILEFKEEFPECWELVAYKNLTVTGFVFARYTKIVTYKQSLIIQQTYLLDSNDSCPLIEAFLNYSSGIEGLELAAQSFIENVLRPFLMNTTLSKEKRVIKISELIIKFIQTSTEYRAFYNAYIIGFGSIRSFLVVSQQYVQLRYVKYVFKGSVDTCVLITTLEERYSQLIAEGQLTIAQQISVIIEECKTEFSSIISFKGRLAIFVKILRDQGKLNWDILEYLYQIFILKFGSIFDLLHCVKYIIGDDHIISTTPSCSCTCV